MKILLHIIIFILLTVITQIGGLLYLVAIISINKTATRKYIKRSGLFIGLYLCATFLIIPNVAPIFGREKIKETPYLQAQSVFYKFANRIYVRPELNNSIRHIANRLGQENSGIKMVYLDASFPFIDKFPLLPHLSHNDGKKIDISLIYEQPNGQLTNLKPSISGYGVFEGPREKEYNQTHICKQKGNWLYDFPKYLTLGTSNEEIAFSEKGTHALMALILNQKEIKKYL